MYGKKDKNNLSRIICINDLKLSVFLTGVQLNRRRFIVVAMSCFTFFTWYYIFSNIVLKFIVDESTKTFSIYNASFNFLISFAMILGSALIRRTDKRSIIYAWFVLSSIGTIVIILAPTGTFKLATYLILGIVFGIGLLAFFSLFWDLTVREERGRVAGLIGFISLPTLLPVVVFLENFDFFRTVMSCIILSLGTLTIKALDPERISVLKTKECPKRYGPDKRTILLYSIPWLTFSLINATLAKAVYYHILQHFSPSLFLFAILQYIGAGLGAIIGGAIADLFGRRPSLALGLTLYGISSAISGLAMTREMFFPAFVGTGLTWGILFTLYSLVIWGDLATEETCDRRYSVGLAIFSSTAGLGALSAPGLFQIPLVAASMASCMLIFLSNIPLILATELLPSDFREEFRLKIYVSLVKKIIKSRKNAIDQSREC